jgi:hypothetical protein
MRPINEGGEVSESVEQACLIFAEKSIVRGHNVRLYRIIAHLRTPRGRDHRSNITRGI